MQGTGAEAGVETEPPEVTDRERGEPAADVAPEESGLRRKVIRGSTLTILVYGCASALRLASNLVLTRLLLEEHFALMALIYVALEGLQMFSDVGLRPAIVQSKRGYEPTFLNTAWTIQVARGLGLWLVACLVGPLMGLAYHDKYPELWYMIPVAALSAPILGLHSTTLHTLLKSMNPGKVLLTELFAQVVSVAVMLSVAAVYRSVWALVIGGLVSPLVITIVSHLLTPRAHNRLHWNRTDARELFHYGRWVFVSTLFTFLARQSDRLVMAKLLSETLMGVYNIALMGLYMCIEVLVHLMEWVAFPAYSRKLNAGDDVRGPFRRATGQLLTLAGAGVATLVSGGPDLIDFLYPDAYAEAGWMLRVLGWSAWFVVLEACCSSLVKALGTTRWMAAGHATKFAVMVPAILIGYSYAGLQGGLLGIVVADLARYLVAAVGLHRQGYPVLLRDFAYTAHLGIAVLIGTQVAARLPQEWWSLVRFLVIAAAASSPWLLPAMVFLGRRRS